jgi:hypothetical protein
MAVPKTSRRGVAGGRPNATIGTRVAIACDHTAVGPLLQDVAIAPTPEARRRSSATSRSPAVQPSDPRYFLCRLCDTLRPVDLRGGTRNICIYCLEDDPVISRSQEAPPLLRQWCLGRGGHEAPARTFLDDDDEVLHTCEHCVQYAARDSGRHSSSTSSRAVTPPPLVASMPSHSQEPADQQAAAERLLHPELPIDLTDTELLRKPAVSTED